MLEGGKFYKFTITRKTDLGYMLNDGTEEVLMFYKEATREFEVGESVSAFLYYDKKQRLCATTKEVYATVQKPGFLEVVSVSSDGVYLNNNTGKDMLLSSDFLPSNKELWPVVGDKVLVLLKLRHKSLVARLVKRSDISSFTPDFIVGENIEARVLDVTPKGLLTYSNSLVPVFIPQILVRGNYHIGSLVKCHITKILPDICYGSLTANKEKQMVADEDIILNYLKEHKKMPFTAKSSSVSIENTFKISRKAFKRAYGKLYKDGKIYFDETTTYLKEE